MLITRIVLIAPLAGMVLSAIHLLIIMLSKPDP